MSNNIIKFKATDRFTYVYIIIISGTILRILYNIYSPIIAFGIAIFVFLLLSTYWISFLYVYEDYIVIKYPYRILRKEKKFELTKIKQMSFILSGKGQDLLKIKAKQDNSTRKYEGAAVSLNLLRLQTTIDLLRFLESKGVTVIVK